MANTPSKPAGPPAQGNAGIQLKGGAALAGMALGVMLVAIRRLRLRFDALLQKGHEIDDVGGDAARMEEDPRRSVGEVEGEVPVADGVETVGGEAAEVEKPSHQVAVDGQRGAGERADAQRQIRRRVQLAQVALEHRAPGAEVVRGADRLRALAGRVAGEQGVALARRLAVRYARSAESRAELTQVASLALIKAVDRFDPTRGVDLGPRRPAGRAPRGQRFR